MRHTEVLRVISSGIAVAGLADQVAKQVIALRRLWGEFNGVPENIGGLVAQLELQPVLADMRDFIFRVAGSLQ